MIKLRPGERLESFGEYGGTIHYDQYAFTLTRRDHFAIAALTGMKVGSEWDASYYARRSYEIADAMEAARNKEGAE